MSDGRALLEGRVFALTGASGGLGRTLAVGLARQGASGLVLFARRAEQLEETRRRALAAGAANVAVCAGDIASERDCARFVEVITQQFAALDGLVNNAGASMWERVSELDSPQCLRRLMEVNYLGPAWCGKLALPLLRESGGMIVNISSIQGRVALPWHSGYAAAKHALEGFYASLAAEEPRLTVLNVRPSWIGGTSLAAGRVVSSREAPPGSSERARPGVEECAGAIIAAIGKRRERLTLPRRYGLLPLLEWGAPRWLRARVSARVEGRMKRGGRGA